MLNTVSTLSNTRLPRIVLSAGEPAGIGPDLIVEITQQCFDAQLSVIADQGVLLQRADCLELPLDLIRYDAAKSIEKHQPGRLYITPIVAERSVQPGVLQAINANYVLSSISKATRACLQNEFDALVTPPVNKTIINQSGTSFTGHTEFIAKLCCSNYPVMMLMNKKLRVVLVTTHLPLSKVASTINSNLVEQVIKITNADLHSLLAIDNPKLLVCGLNPHAEKNDHLGDEEIDIIVPVLEKLRSRGLNLIGPVPADTAFTEDNLDTIDAVITMYHDQGLPVLKSHGFGETVNITLGLPIIRTSVDHGTALDLAGTGKASASSLNAAITCAIDLVLNKQR